MPIERRLSACGVQVVASMRRHDPPTHAIQRCIGTGSGRNTPHCGQVPCLAAIGRRSAAPRQQHQHRAGAAGIRRRRVISKHVLMQTQFRVYQ